MNVSARDGRLTHKIQVAFPFVYLREIVIFLHTPDEHFVHARQVLILLCDTGVTLGLE